jgi:hypothetical protein
MTLTIWDDSITSDQSAHTARPVANQEYRWEVSWLPGRSMDRNSAITAMVLADVTGPGDLHTGHHLWPHVEGWAAELGLTAPDVLAHLARPPDWTMSADSPQPSDPEAAG